MLRVSDSIKKLQSTALNSYIENFMSGIFFLKSENFRLNFGRNTLENRFVYLHLTQFGNSLKFFFSVMGNVNFTPSHLIYTFHDE